MNRGAALPSVLLALTLTSALAVGGAYVARQHAASARMSQIGIELLPAAEEALVDAMVRWDTLTMHAQSMGAGVALRSAEYEGKRTEVWSTRTGPAQFWLVAQVTTGVRPALRRRIGVFVTTSSGVPKVVSSRGWVELP